MSQQENTLRRELSFAEVIALSIGIMAPTAAMALNGSLAASVAGSAVPLAFLIATIAVGFASFSFIQFNSNLFPYVALLWLLVGLIITFISPTLVQRIGTHFTDDNQPDVEVHAGQPL